jgi:hypothetical protein
MPKRILPLTDIQVKNAKPKTKEYKLADGGGLYLLITPSGGKLWRFKYRFGGVEKRLTFKTYPEVSLADARHRRDDARKLIANGADPASILKAQKEEKLVAETTFEKVAREWFSKNEPVWSESHCKTVKSRLERDVYPVIGTRLIADITRCEVIALIRRVEARGVIETADRIKIFLVRFFDMHLTLNLLRLIRLQTCGMSSQNVKRGIMRQLQIQRFWPGLCGL